MKVPFGSLTVTDNARKYVNEALDNDRVSQGSFVKRFEESFAEFAGTKYAVAVNSGTAAISIALSTLYEVGFEVKRGQEIIVPALTFIASANAILQAGFIPKFVDIEEDTLNISTRIMYKNRSSRTAGVLPVHLMGKPANMDGMPVGLPIIEDCAEAHGATYKGQKVGTFGLAGCYSLYVAHIISSMEGGVIVTDDKDVRDIARSLRNHGRLCDCNVCVINKNPDACPVRVTEGMEEGNSIVDPRFIFPRIGYSAKMNELEAAVGLGTLEVAEEILDQRKENYYYYDREFDRFQDFFTTIKEGRNDKIGPHAYPIILKKDAPFTRDKFAYYLQENGIDSRTLFGSIPTQSEGYSWMNYKYGKKFPVAEYVGNHGLHIGVHQGLGKEEREYVIKIIEEFLK